MKPTSTSTFSPSLLADCCLPPVAANRQHVADTGHLVVVVNLITFVQQSERPAKLARILFWSRTCMHVLFHLCLSFFFLSIPPACVPPAHCIVWFASLRFCCANSVGTRLRLCAGAQAVSFSVDRCVFNAVLRLIPPLTCQMHDPEIVEGLDWARRTIPLSEQILFCFICGASRHCAR